MGDRYFTFELACLDSDNFDYVGKRTTGSKAGEFALVGPTWRGELPPGVTALAPSRTNSILIFGRTVVDGVADLPAVRMLQDQYRLTPLSLRGRDPADLPQRRDVWAPAPTSDPLGPWKTKNRAMTEDPPERRLSQLMNLFATIGIGPGQDVESQEEAVRRGLARAAPAGRRLLQSATGSGRLGQQVNNWSLPRPTFGRAGLADDWLLRGAVQCLGGIIANEPAEAVYANTTRDESGETFDGARRYVLRLAPGQLPQVKAFWSLSLYDPTFNFTPNPLDRYAIGDRTPGLQLDADGGLTIYLQSTAPAGKNDANWLPTPPSGPLAPNSGEDSSFRREL